MRGGTEACGFIHDPPTPTPPIPLCSIKPLELKSPEDSAGQKPHLTEGENEAPSCRGQSGHGPRSGQSKSGESPKQRGRQHSDNFPKPPERPQHMGLRVVIRGVHPAQAPGQQMSSALQLQGGERREGRGKRDADWLIQIPTERAPPLRPDSREPHTRSLHQLPTPSSPPCRRCSGPTHGGAAASRLAPGPSLSSAPSSSF